MPLLFKKMHRYTPSWKTMATVAVGSVIVCHFWQIKREKAAYYRAKKTKLFGKPHIHDHGHYNDLYPEICDMIRGIQGADKNIIALLDECANAECVYREAKKGATRAALFLPIKFGCLEAVKLFVERGVDTEAVCTYENENKPPIAAIKLAIQCRHPKIVEYLLEHSNADPFKTYPHPKDAAKTETYYEMALRRKKKKIALILQKDLQQRSYFQRIIAALPRPW